MTKKQMKSYRLTGMEEPTDEHLAQLMTEVAKVAKNKNQLVHKKLFQDIQDAVVQHKQVWLEKYNISI
ncbi:MULTISPECIES: hypothetical protein [unclassified Parabacteroides]|uniref:hypothetical protein n=1 Tax=unclassified Parabacteroides TaxID=2649774 RepID=UPI002475ECD7|nr:MULTISPECIES: hypothetical protein [unclassified Parabacteroides]